LSGSVSIGIPLCAETGIFRYPIIMQLMIIPK
jgi:hypothetical protein